MAITYTPTTNFGAKDSLPTNDPDKVIKGSEFTTEFTAIQTAFSLAATAASPTFTGTATLPSVDINGGTIDGTSIGASSKSSGAFTSLEVSATSPSLLFTETDVTDKNTKFLNSAGNFFIQEISNDGLTSVNRIKLDHTTGNMTFYDDTSAGTVLFLDAVNNRAGINTINPASTLDVNGTVTADGLTVSGTTSLAGASTTADITFGDNDKAIFGAGSDLQIYHDGSASYIDDAGTGNLRIRANSSLSIQKYTGETMGVFTADGSVLLAYDNATKFETTATGIDVTGTVTADGLAVSTSSAVTAQLGRDGSDGDVLQIYNGAIGTTKALALGVDFTSGIIESQFGNIDIKAGSALAAKFASGGDISFYEDTGTTPKFFWDASAESLGIGTTSIDLTSAGRTVVQVEGSSNALLNLTDGTSRLYLHQKGGTSGADIWNSANSYMRFATNDTEAMRIDASGNVGIGTTSPSTLVEASKSQNAVTDIKVTNANAGAAAQSRFTLGNGGANFGAVGLLGSSFTTAGVYRQDGTYLYSNGAGGLTLVTGAAQPIYFAINNSEKMRIDSAGNVGIGTTPAYFVDAYRDANDNAPTLALRNVNAGASAASRLYMEANGNNFNIYVNGDGTANANITQFRSTAGGGQFTFETASQERMRIDASGNVSIGTTGTDFESSGRKVLRVEGSTNALISASDGTSFAYFHQKGGTNGVDIWNTANSYMRFGTNNDEKMRIDSSGNLLVGTTSNPDTLITATSGSGIAVGEGGFLVVTREGALNNRPCLFLNQTGVDGEVAKFLRDGAIVGTITVTGSATAYNTSSDYRLKNVDGPITNSGAYIDALKPVQGSWKADGSRFIGLIAHEVQEVSETQIATGEKDGEEMQGMDYSAPELIANLIAEIQSLRARVAQLEGA